MRALAGRITVAVVLLVAGCSDASGAGTAPASLTPPKPDNVVRVVNLNAAMGYRAGKGDPAGTDANPEDLALLVRDIVNQRGDVANLQEMALPAAKEVRKSLRELTGNDWQLNWAHTVDATYYPGRSRDESPTYEEVSSGNAQLIQLGDGIVSQKPITLDDENDDQGIVLPSGGRAFLGTEITTVDGVFDVYNTHLSLSRQVSDTDRATDIRRIQETTESRPNPVIITGDFNQTIDVPDPSQQTMAAIQAFLQNYGYVDVAANLGPTIDQKHPEDDSRRIDYIFTRGVPTTDPVRFVSHESDHWGLAVSIL